MPVLAVIEKAGDRANGLLTRALVSVSFLAGDVMRVFAILLALILFSPAVTRACECCSSTPQDGALSIQRTPCHGCCPEYQALPEAQSALHEKSIFLMEDSRSVNVLNRFQSDAGVTDAQKKDPLFVVFSPPPSSFHTLPVVLRI